MTPAEQIDELKRTREDLFAAVKSLRDAITYIEEAICELVEGPQI